MVTLVVYFGTERWDGARALSDMLLPTDAEIADYVQDYKLALIEPSGVEDTDFERFTTDLGKVLQFMKYAKDENKMNKILYKDATYQNMNRKAAQVLKACANIAIPEKEETEEVDMCKAWEDHRLSGVREGEQKGRQEQIQEIALKMHKKGYSVEQICDVVDISEGSLKELIEKVQPEMV